MALPRPTRAWVDAVSFRRDGTKRERIKLEPRGCNFIFGSPPEHYCYNHYTDRCWEALTFLERSKIAHAEEA